MPHRVPPILLDIINTVADPIFVKDQAHRWILVNDAFCRFMGHSRETLIGKSDFDFFSKEEAQVFWDIDDKVLQSGETVENEERFTLAGGKTRIISTKKSVFVGPDGGKRLVGVIRDLTELKLAEERMSEALELAKAASATKTRFLANVSHELRTPLNGIVGMTSLLLDNELPAELTDQVSTLKDSADHLLHLVNEILELTALEGKPNKAARSVFSIPSFVRGLESMFEPERVRCNIELNVSIADSIPQFVWGDEHRLRQVLVNLLGNAMKFAPLGGLVTLNVSKESMANGRAMLQFSVSDNGPGIPESELEQVFQPFVKLRSGYAGTGLGLAIVAELAQLLGGAVTVSSRLGEGTEFSFRVPLDLATNAESRAAVKDRDSGDATKFVARVLVVEDDPVSRKVAAFTLKKLGCEVLTAENGLKALEMLIDQDVHLILLDCQMPVMDGYDFCREYRRREAAENKGRLPIVALTAHALDHERKRCLAAGMDEWLTKPLIRERLVETMSRFLAV